MGLQHVAFLPSRARIHAFHKYSGRGENNTTTLCHNTVAESTVLMCSL